MNKIIEPAMRLALEVPNIMDSVNKKKSIPKALLKEGYCFIIYSTNIKSSQLLRRLRITLTNNKKKDVTKVIKFLENKGYF